MRLILASGSPRRAELLRNIGLRFESRAADVDESIHPGEAPDAYVLRLARNKAEAVRAAMGEVPDTVVLGADTAVVLDDRVLGKPLDRADGIAMLQSLSGRAHRVMTGVAVSDASGTRSECVVTEVRFRHIEAWEADAYWRTEEGADKAGGYGIQGIGGIFAVSVCGSYSAVVGLPLAETERLLRASGVETWHDRPHG